MPNTEMLTDFVDPKAEEQIPRMTKRVGELVAEMTRLTTAAQQFSNELGQNQNFAQFIASMQRITATNQAMSNTVVNATGQLQALSQAQSAAADSSKNAAERTAGVMTALGNGAKSYIANLKGVAQAEHELERAGTEREKQMTESAKRSIAERLVSQQALLTQARIDSEQVRQGTAQQLTFAKVGTESAKQQTAAQIAAAKAATEHSRQLDIQTKTNIALQKEQDRLNRLAATAATNAARQQGEYAKLNAEYKSAAQLAKDLGAQEIRLQTELKALKSNNNGPGNDALIAAKTDEITKLTPVLKEAQLNAKKLSDSLYSVEIAVGQGQRKVGQYSEAARGLRDILREAPAFAYSTATGILAISNNIPMLLDGVKKLKEANEALAAAGEKPIPIWKTLLKELFSFEGIAAMVVAGVTILVARMAMMHKPVDDATDSVKKYNEALTNLEENAYTSAVTDAARMKLLVGVAQDVKESMDTRLGAVQALQKEFPAYFANLKDEAILNGNVTEAVEKTTDAIFKQAAARAAMAKFEEASKIDYDLKIKQTKALEEVEKALAEARKKMSEETIKRIYNENKAANSTTIKSYLTDQDETADEAYFRKTVGSAQKNLDEITKMRNKTRTEMSGFFADAVKFGKELVKVDDIMPGTVEAMEKQIERLTHLRDQLLNIGEKEGLTKAKAITAEIKALQKQIDEIRGKDDHAGKSGARTDLERRFQAEKHYAEAIEALQNQILQQQMAHEKAQMDSTYASLDDRLGAYEQYYALLLQAAENDKDKAIAIEQAKINQLQQKIDLNHKANGTILSGSEIASSKMDIAASQLAILGITQKFEAERAKLTEAGSREVLKIQKDEAQKRLDFITDLTNNINSQEQERLQILVDKLDKGVITYKQYTRAKQAIEDEYAKRRTAGVIEYLQEEVDALSAQGVDVRNLVDKLNEYRVKAQEAANKAIEDRNNKKKNPLLRALGVDDEQWQAAQQVGSAAIQLLDEVTKAVDARYQREIDQLEHKKQLLEENASTDIAAINKAFLSEKQKAEKIAAINAKLAYDKKEADQQERELKRKMAIADKANSAAKVIEGTAVAVINALSIPIGGQVLAAILAAIGAVQLATVLATPLPQYWDGVNIKGKPQHPGGPALVAEAGRPEIVMDRGIVRVYDEPTILDLTRQARVIPEHRLYENMHYLPQPLQRRGVSENEYAPMVMSMQPVVSALARVEGAIGKIPQVGYYPHGFGGATRNTAKVEGGVVVKVL